MRRAGCYFDAYYSGECVPAGTYRTFSQKLCNLEVYFIVMKLIPTNSPT